MPVLYDGTRPVVGGARDKWTLALVIVAAVGGAAMSHRAEQCLPESSPGAGQQGHACLGLRADAFAKNSSSDAFQHLCMIVLRLAQSTTEPGYMPRLHADCVNEPVQLQLRDCLQLVQVVITPWSLKASA